MEVTLLAVVSTRTVANVAFSANCLRFSFLAAFTSSFDNEEISFSVVEGATGTGERRESGELSFPPMSEVVSSMEGEDTEEGNGMVIEKGDLWDAF